MGSVKETAPVRGVQDVTKGDYVKTDQGWLMIESNSAYQAHPLPRSWTISTVDGQRFTVSEKTPKPILRYATAEDMT